MSVFDNLGHEAATQAAKKSGPTSYIVPQGLFNSSKLKTPRGVKLGPRPPEGRFRRPGGNLPPRFQIALHRCLAGGGVAEGWCTLLMTAAAIVTRSGAGCILGTNRQDFCCQALWPMLSLHDEPYRLCDRISRRKLMRIGGLNLLGLSLPTLLAARSARCHDRGGRSDVWPRQERHLSVAARRTAAARDVRPQARCAAGNSRAVQADRDQRAGHPVLRIAATRAQRGRQAGGRALDVDGRQHPRHERLLGVDRQQVSLRKRPRDQADRLAVLRLGGQDAQAEQRVPALSSVWIPDIMRLNDNVRPAGQTGGFLGAQWDPDRFIGDPSDEHYQVEGLGLQPGMSPLRLQSRAALFEQVGRHLDEAEPARTSCATLTTFVRRPLGC